MRGHHERWDGHGYPDGLTGREISIFARIAALADAFDALTSERRHAPARSRAEGVAAIREEAGKAFDPELTETFCATIAASPRRLDQVESGADHGLASISCSP